MKGYRARVAHLERRVRRNVSGPISNWDDYGAALANGSLPGRPLTPEFEEVMKALIVKKLRVFVRNRGSEGRRGFGKTRLLEDPS